MFILILSSFFKILQILNFPDIYFKFVFLYKIAILLNVVIEIFLFTIWIKFIRTILQTRIRRFAIKFQHQKYLILLTTIYKVPLPSLVLNLRVLLLSWFSSSNYNLLFFLSLVCLHACFLCDCVCIFVYFSFWTVIFRLSFLFILIMFC